MSGCARTRIDGFAVSVAHFGHLFGWARGNVTRQMAQHYALPF